MTTNLKNTPKAMILLYLLLFTLATGSFKSVACELSRVKSAGGKCPEVVEAPVKKVTMPMANPLQVLTSKFI